MKYNPDVHHRRSMRLKDYDYSLNGLYFTTIRTQYKANLFGEIVGAALCGRPDNADTMILKWVNEIENKFENVKIDKYVIMPNHLHFILCLQGGSGQGGHTGPPLQEIVDWFKTMTTNEYIRGVKSGIYPPFNKRIWQRSYHDHIIRNEAEYQKIWQYIDENPSKWQDDCYYGHE